MNIQFTFNLKCPEDTDLIGYWNDFYVSRGRTPIPTLPGDELNGYYDLNCQDITFPEEIIHLVKNTEGHERHLGDLLKLYLEFQKHGNYVKNLIRAINDDNI